MEALIVKIPMVVLTWLAMACVWLMYEIPAADISGKLIVMITAICTLLAALLKHMKERSNARELQRNRAKISVLEQENVTLLQVVERFEQERAAFRAELRAGLRDVREQLNQVKNEPK